MTGSKAAKVQWKVIKEFPMYEVSNTGEVYSMYKDRLRKKTINGGYYQVRLHNDRCKKHMRVNILVATAFLENADNLPSVDHIDNNRFNNHVNNLRWFTQTDNTQSYYDNFKEYIPILQYDLKGNLIKKWKNVAKILKYFPHYKRKLIYANLVGKSKSSCGFVWKYQTPKEKKKIILKDDEIFKTIGIFEGNDLSSYKVSNYGNIQTSKGKIMSLKKTHQGYLRINLTIAKKELKTYQAHRLVAHAFISPSISNKIEVNHLDENKSNNYYKNLEWATSKDNTIYSIGKKIKMVNPETNKILIIFRSITEAHEHIGKTNDGRVISVCKRGVCKSGADTVFGYKWRYLKDNETLDTFKNNPNIFIYDL